MRVFRAVPGVVSSPSSVGRPVCLLYKGIAARGQATSCIPGSWTATNVSSAIVRPHHPGACSCSELSASEPDRQLDSSRRCSGEGASTSQATHAISALAATAATLAGLLLPLSAIASEGNLSGDAVEVFKDFLEVVEQLGPGGPVLFVLVVMLCEMVPLFPTQPLSLASGLLFGGPKGAALMLLGVTLAACNAFLIARGVGRPFAQRIIDAEMQHASGSGAGEAGGSSVTGALAKVEATIQGGGFSQQVTAVTLLRLTPVVPFSASNYLLGLTPLPLPAFLAGTLAGMSVWSTVYASLGGASRALLDGGEDLGALMAELGGKASSLSGSVVAGSGVVAAVAAVVWFSQQRGPAAAGAAAAGPETPTAPPAHHVTSTPESSKEEELVSATHQSRRP